MMVLVLILCIWCYWNLYFFSFGESELVGMMIREDLSCFLFCSLKCDGFFEFDIKVFIFLWRVIILRVFLVSCCCRFVILYFMFIILLGVCSIVILWVFLIFCCSFISFCISYDLVLDISLGCLLFKMFFCIVYMCSFFRGKFR